MKDENISKYRLYEFFIKILLWAIVICILILEYLGAFDSLPGYQQNLILALALSTGVILTYFMPSKIADRYFEKAMKHIDKDPDKAIEYLEEYISSRTISDNERKHALRVLGVTHFQKGDYSKAIEILKQVLESHGKDNELKVEVLGVLGIIYSEAGDYQQAVEYFDRTFEVIFSISKAYIDKNILFQVMNTYIKAGQQERARLIYDRLLMIRGFRRNKRIEELLYGNTLPF